MGKVKGSLVTMESQPLSLTIAAITQVGPDDVFLGETEDS